MKERAIAYRYSAFDEIRVSNSLKSRVAISRFKREPLIIIEARGIRSWEVGIRRLGFPTSGETCIVDSRSMNSRRCRGSVGPQKQVEDRWLHIGGSTPRGSGFGKSGC
jgi:hypothetical protein